jgi:trans-aconitate 2-methyltransferase
MAADAQRDWDAASYDRVCDPQLQWAREQLDRLALAGDEVVLDAGCGSGRVTAELAALVPHGRIYAVDVAPSMVRHTRAALGDRVTVLCQDLVALSLPEPVQVAFSNATFHWIPDHDALFAALYRALSPGGRLLAQCGGHGNIEQFGETAEAVAAQAPFAACFEGWERPWNYATAAQTSARLTAAGFTDVSCWLQTKSVTPTDPRAFVRTVVLVRHLDPLPDDLRGSFVDRVLERMGEPLVLEYVRLNMSARRPPA